MTIGDPCQEELSRCIVELLLVEPFFGHILGGVVRIIDPEVATAGVRYSGGRFYLHLNDRWFRQQLRTRSERIAVIKHEALHLILQHLFRFDPHRHDRFRFGVAADLVVNQLIGRWKLPADGLQLSVFPGLPPDRSLEDYYSMLDQMEFPQEFVEEARHSDHGRWGVEDPTDRAMAEAELARLAQQAVDRCDGRVPNGLQWVLEQLLQPRQLPMDWRRQLRLFHLSSNRTRRADSLRRPSRRYHTFPGLKVRHRQRLFVVVDTSASVSDSALGKFFAEIQGIFRAGAEVWVIECDEQVQRQYPWVGRAPPAVHGRGGTQYDPVFRWINGQRSAPDACIFLTDGQAAAPLIRPTCPLLWVIPTDGTAENLRFGRVIRMRG